MAEGETEIEEKKEAGVSGEESKVQGEAGKEEKGVKVEEKTEDTKEQGGKEKSDATSKEKIESKPAVEKKIKDKKGGSKVELEREYIVPLRKGVLNAPSYRRAKRAVSVLKEFLAKHMKVENRDLKKVKIDIYLNNELWFRGIKKPANKIKVKAKKIGGIVYAELAEVPEFVKFAKARAEKRNAAAEKAKVKTPKHVKEEAKSEEEKIEEKEDVKAGAEVDAKIKKVAAKTQKHTAQGKHAKKSMPVRKALKK